MRINNARKSLKNTAIVNDKSYILSVMEIYRGSSNGREVVSLCIDTTNASVDRSLGDTNQNDIDLLDTAQVLGT